VSEALAGSKRFYSEVEKICYDVVMASRKLRHYFEAHRIRVLTSQPLNEIFGNRESSGRISKWALELSEHVVDFEKRSAIKSQVLADFVSDWTEPNSFADGPIPDAIWTLHCDGAWGCAGAGAAAILTSPSGVSLKYAARLDFCQEPDRCTNSIAEYEAVLLGLRKLGALGVKHCIIKTDSKVVVDQVEKQCATREPQLIKYLAEVRSMERHFCGFTLQHIEWSRNSEADELAKAAAQRTLLPPDVFSETLRQPSVNTCEPEPKMINLVTSED
jgi:ribonuclease HI